MTHTDRLSKSTPTQHNIYKSLSKHFSEKTKLRKQANTKKHIAKLMLK